MPKRRSRKRVKIREVAAQTRGSFYRSSEYEALSPREHAIFYPYYSERQRYGGSTVSRIAPASHGRMFQLLREFNTPEIREGLSRINAAGDTQDFYRYVRRETGHNAVEANRSTFQRLVREFRENREDLRSLPGPAYWHSGPYVAR